MSQRRSIDEAKKGSAEILILSAVEDEAHHGYQIAKLIEQRPTDILALATAAGLLVLAAAAACLAPALRATRVSPMEGMK